ncbi:isoprenoid biosynthesis glyoxalase ElbB [Paludibacterium paludis]|uniref:Glyoxalase n=1 Tax=Paludibacterium paludis TaxID=1225769 RepID=A0A918UB70_9NEIS|nr:isoprenoid biosynthesis glyoxalase ElbB [Paludibacterium paludis]GGY22545.1 glyoxalase [Paludibacterium paludis]
MKRIALILSGCGVYDGTEITEAAGLLIALSQSGHQVKCFAPDRPQSDVVDHATGDKDDTRRNILAESARIARGTIEPLEALREAAFDAVAFPGGFGAAKNLLPFASDGQAARLAPDVAAVARDFIAAGKPLLALCAAPLVLGAAARDAGILGARITFGHLAEGKDLADAIEAWGQVHVEKAVDEPCVDTVNRFVSVPAYMYGAATPAQVFSACQAGVTALDELLGTTEPAA